MKTKLDKKLYLKLQNYFKSYQQNKTKIKNMYKYVCAKMAKYDYKLEIKNQRLNFILKQPKNMKIGFIFNFFYNDINYSIKYIDINNISKSIHHDLLNGKYKYYFNKISKNIKIDKTINKNEIGYYLAISKNKFKITIEYSFYSKKEKYIHIEITKNLELSLNLAYSFKNYFLNNKMYSIKIQHVNEGQKSKIFYKYISCFNIVQTYRFNNFIDLI